MRSARVLSIAGAAIAAVQATSVAIPQKVTTTTTTIAIPAWEANTTTSWTSDATCDKPSYTEPEPETTTLLTTVGAPNTTGSLRLLMPHSIQS
jgi:hypothetical protein